MMLRKFWNKKGLNFCLLVGCILLIATAVSFPLYRSAAYDLMLEEQLGGYQRSTGKWPMVINAMISARKDPEGKTITKMEAFSENVYSELGVKKKETVEYYYNNTDFFESEMNRSDSGQLSLRAGMLSNLESKVNIIAGESYSESGYSSDGAVEVIINQDCMGDLGLLLGETVRSDGVKFPDGSPARLKVVGVFEPIDRKDPYWQMYPTDLRATLFIRSDVFKELFTGVNASKRSLTCIYYSIIDYESVRADQIQSIVDKTDYMLNSGSYKSVLKKPVYPELLDEYLRKENRISATLAILMIPIMVMLAAFLFMISGQMYALERSEISVIKSRGGSSMQILGLYLGQSLLLSIFGALFGIPLGSLFARFLGAARNFLEFDFSKPLNVKYTGQGFLFAGVAMAVTLLSLTIPALKHSKVGIVELKHSRRSDKKKLWEIVYLDLILIGLSLYGWWSFGRNSQSMSESVLAGKGLDPLLYISSSLFLLGCGLLFLRLWPKFVKLIFLVGKKRWNPAVYVSFRETERDGAKRRSIMLFLILTIGLGMYHSGVARTILENAVENRQYLDGTDIIMREVWTEMIGENGENLGTYYEPDYSKYASMPFASSYTKVVVGEKGTVSSSGEKGKVTVYGIHTKEFGQLTSLRRDLTQEHYYAYLNKLAVVPDGVLLSSNFRDKDGIAEGDTIYFSCSLGSQLKGTVVGFIDYFPGYSPKATEVGADGNAFTADRYLVVTHYDYLKRKWGVKPYEVWIGMKDGYTSDDVKEWINDNNIRLTKYVNLENDTEEVTEDPLLQGTNGVLTMGFVVTLILCAIGYLIYWILSVRERELVFGVLRAFGFHKKEVFQMLLVEQLFSGVLSVLAGIGIGKLSEKLFVPIVQQAYASAQQVIPMRLIENATDNLKIYIVIGVVMAVCVIVLIGLLAGMNITKALKLGEE